MIDFKDNICQIVDIEMMVSFLQVNMFCFHIKVKIRVFRKGHQERVVILFIGEPAMTVRSVQFGCFHRNQNRAEKTTVLYWTFMVSGSDTTSTKL